MLVRLRQTIFQGSLFIGELVNDALHCSIIDDATDSSYRFTSCFAGFIVGSHLLLLLGTLMVSLLSSGSRFLLLLGALVGSLLLRLQLAAPCLLSRLAYTVESFGNFG